MKMNRIKKCKFCAEDIAYDAKVCKHCGKSQEKKQTLKFMLIAIGLITSLCFLGTIISVLSSGPLETSDVSGDDQSRVSSPSSTNTSRPKSTSTLAPIPKNTATPTIQTCHLGMEWDEFDIGIVDVSITIIGPDALEGCEEFKYSANEESDGTWEWFDIGPTQYEVYYSDGKVMCSYDSYDNKLVVRSDNPEGNLMTEMVCGAAEETFGSP